MSSPTKTRRSDGANASVAAALPPAPSQPNLPSDLKNLYQALKGSELDRLLECRFCHKRVDFASELLVHLRRHTADVDAVAESVSVWTGGRKLRCHLCKNKSSYTLSYATHLDGHPVAGGLKCPICGCCDEDTASPAKFSRHMEIHHPSVIFAEGSPAPPPAAATAPVAQPTPPSASPASETASPSRPAVQTMSPAVQNTPSPATPILQPLPPPPPPPPPPSLPQPHSSPAPPSSFPASASPMAAQSSPVVPPSPVQAASPAAVSAAAAASFHQSPLSGVVAPPVNLEDQGEQGGKEAMEEEEDVPTADIDEEELENVQARKKKKEMLYGNA